MHLVAVAAASHAHISPMPPAAPASTLLWVAAGGALGSALRYGVAEWARRIPALAGFPWATLSVNVSGSFALGAVAGWALDSDASPGLRAFLMIGVLGGYTTFSSFAFEGLAMLQRGEALRAAGYALVSVLLSVAAAAIGFGITRG